MAADLEQPTISNTHVNVLPQIVDNQTALARMFSDGGEANIPLRSVRFLNNTMYLWSGSAWDVAPIAVSGGGTGAQTAANARANLGTDNAVNITQGILDTDRIPTLSITDKTSGTLGGTRVDQSTTSARGTVQLNNTLTSTSTTQALTAAQGKVLKDNADSMSENVSIAGTSIGASSGSLNITREGNIVTVGGILGHASLSVFGTNVDAIPASYRPARECNNLYYSSNGDFLCRIQVLSGGNIVFRYWDFSGTAHALSTTLNFNITYSVV